MSPDTAALRALANNVSRLGAPQEFTDEEDFAGLGMGRAERRYYAALDPDTVRALCDAADEVERHRSMTRELSRELLKKGDEVERLRAEVDAVLALCDAADEAHKAYLAGVILDRFIMPSNVTTKRVRAALDRHAPEEGS